MKRLYKKHITQKYQSFAIYPTQTQTDKKEFGRHVQQISGKKIILRGSSTAQSALFAALDPFFSKIIIDLERLKLTN